MLVRTWFIGNASVAHAYQSDVNSRISGISGIADDAAARLISIETRSLMPEPMVASHESIRKVCWIHRTADRRTLITVADYHPAWLTSRPAYQIRQGLPNREVFAKCGWQNPNLGAGPGLRPRGRWHGQAQARLWISPQPHRYLHDQGCPRRITIKYLI